MLPAGLLFLVFFSQILTYSCRRNGNNKVIECSSNDSTVLISVLLMLVQRVPYCLQLLSLGLILSCCYQFELVYL